MRTPDGDRIFSIIRSHVGAENAIDAFDICDELGWSSSCARNVRRIIAQEFTEWPDIVCARVGAPDGQGGYFIPADYLEIESYWAYLDDLRARAEEKVQNFEQFCSKHGINLKFAKAA